MKEPITSKNLGNYMYTMECKLGDATLDEPPSLCIIDSTTSISSIWNADAYHQGMVYNPKYIEYSSTFERIDAEGADP